MVPHKTPSTFASNTQLLSTAGKLNIKIIKEIEI